MAELSLRLGILIPSLVFLCLHNKNDYVWWAPDTIVSLYAAFLASAPHFQRLGRYRKRGRHSIQEGEKGHLDFSAHLDHDSVPRPGKARGEWGSCSGGQQEAAGAARTAGRLVVRSRSGRREALARPVGPSVRPSFLPPSPSGRRRADRALCSSAGCWPRSRPPQPPPHPTAAARAVSPSSPQEDL